jgi:hypothetical protein
MELTGFSKRWHGGHVFTCVLLQDGMIRFEIHAVSLVSVGSKEVNETL